MENGQWYYVVLGFGWVIVGQMEERVSPFEVWLSGARFVVNAGTNHGEASAQGLKGNATTRPVGADGRVCINPAQAVWLTKTVEPERAGDE